MQPQHLQCRKHQQLPAVRRQISATGGRQTAGKLVFHLEELPTIQRCTSGCSNSENLVAAGAAELY